MPLNKPVDGITEEDLLGLIENAVGERKILDYKSGWDLDNAKGKDEFRRDVTSFANASGGHIIYGMREKTGTPVELVGLEIKSPEAIRLRLSELLQSHIRPRIPGIEVGIVSPLQNGKAVVVVAIPRSFVKPHQVLALGSKDDYQFWCRNAGGKYRLDVDELRLAFTLSDMLSARVRNFRLERLGNILADETPVPLQAGAKAVLHLVPLSAFDPSTRHSLSNAVGSLNAQPRWGVRYRYNFEGFLTWMNAPATRYLQVMRTGALEVVSTDLLNQNQKYVPTAALEEELLLALPELLAVQQALGVESPILVFLSLVGVEGYRLAVPGGMSDNAIRQNVLPIPPETVESFNMDALQVLSPIFDILWNAGGFDRCGHIADGKWRIG